MTDQPTTITDSLKDILLRLEQITGRMGKGKKQSFIFIYGNSNYYRY
jgi:hypothetical protein